MAGIGSLVLASPVLAQIQLTPDTTGTFGQLGSLTIEGIIKGLITLVLVVAALVFFFMLVIGGIRWILSGGEKQSVESARNQITNALIGLVIVFAAWAILALIKTLFNVDLLGGLTIPTLY